MGKFRKKPVEIEAVKLHAAEPGEEASLFSEMPDWLEDALQDGQIEDGGTQDSDWVHLKIRTLEGSHLATPGDYIIRGVQGELSPCKPDIFETTYDPVDG